MSDLRVPKEKLEVSVKLISNETLDGYIFVELFPEHIAGFERLMDFIEDDNDFFPFVSKDGGAVFLYKNNIKVIKWHPGEETEDDKARGAIMHREDILITYLDATTMEGTLLSEVRDTEARISDCLNFSRRFLLLLVDGEYRFVNKLRIEKVEGR